LKQYPYVHSYRDRHGKLRSYYRRNGRQNAIPHEPGTPAFKQAYDVLHRAEGCVPDTVKPGMRKGTWRWLCSCYFQSMDFGQLDARTQHVRRLILESTCREPWSAGSKEVFGDAPLLAMTPKAVSVLRDRKLGLPEAATGRLKAINRVFAWAMLPENGIQGITSNPVKSVRRPQSRSEGYHSWTPDEVARFEKRHPIGTMARLALALFLFTGQRRSDVVLFGPQHIKDGVLAFTQQKNRARRPVRLKLPVLPELQSVIDASPCGMQTFLVTAFGKPFDANGFGNKMRTWCDQAELPKCTAHGLRKAGAAIAAQNGATPHQLMSIFGWRTLKEAERYTKAADQKRIAAGAMTLLMRANGSGDGADPPSHRVSTTNLAS
jgi:integrase